MIWYHWYVHIVQKIHYHYMNKCKRVLQLNSKTCLIIYVRTNFPFVSWCWNSAEFWIWSRCCFIFSSSKYMTMSFPIPNETKDVCPSSWKYYLVKNMWLSYWFLILWWPCCNFWQCASRYYLVPDILIYTYAKFGSSIIICTIVIKFVASLPHYLSNSW